MFTINPYNDKSTMGTNSTEVLEASTYQLPVAASSSQREEAFLFPPQYVSLKDQSEIPSVSNHSNNASITNNNGVNVNNNNNAVVPPNDASVDADIAKLMAQVNDSLERELKETKKAVKRIFKEIVAFHKASIAIHAQWAPIREAEHQEAIRLDELYAEVQGTIGAFPGGYIHHDNSTTDVASSK
jgi:hypothetical protein